jgi:hypothetical protein
MSKVNQRKSTSGGLDGQPKRVQKGSALFSHDGFFHTKPTVIRMIPVFIDRWFR